MDENVLIKKADFNDLNEILNLQKLCYQKEAIRYNDYRIPPLTETINEIQTDFMKSVFIKAMIGSKIIGSIKGHVDNSSCHVGRLMVHPKYQRKGIGKKLIKYLEDYFSEIVERFELFAGEKSFDNINLYEKCGYNIYKTEVLSDLINIVYMEKFIKL